MKKRWKDFLHADIAVLFLSGVLLVLFAVSELYPKLDDAALPGSLALRCLLLVLICLISYLGGILYRGRTGDGRMIGWLLTAYFILYVYLLLSLTLMDETLRLDPARLESAGMSRRAYYMKWFVNFRPFYSIRIVYIQGFL